MYLNCFPVLFVTVAILAPIHMHYTKEEFKWAIDIVQRVAVGGLFRLTKVVDVICTKNDCPKLYAKVKAVNAIGMVRFQSINLLFVFCYHCTFANIII